jgi:hypothetical protein
MRSFWISTAVGLFVAIAIVPIARSLQSDLPVVGLLCGSKEDTEAYGVKVARLKDISPVGVTPEEDDPFFLERPLDLLGWHADWLELIRTIWTDHRVGKVDFVERLREVHIVGHFLFKEMNICPTREMLRSGAPIVLERWNYDVIRRLAILIERYCLTAADEGNYSFQLLSRIKLGVVGNLILLVNEPIAHGRRNDQEKGEDSNGSRPFDHSPVKYSLGAIIFCFALWLIWWGICHFIYTAKRDWVIVSSLGAIALGVSLTYCGMWLITS